MRLVCRSQASSCALGNTFLLPEPEPRNVEIAEYDEFKGEWYSELRGPRSSRTADGRHIKALDSAETKAAREHNRLVESTLQMTESGARTAVKASLEILAGEMGGQLAANTIGRGLVAAAEEGSLASRVAPSTRSRLTERLKQRLDPRNYRLPGTLYSGIPIPEYSGAAPKARSIAQNTTAAAEGFDLALGLSKHPDHRKGGLIGRFSEHVGAKTYWDFYENTANMEDLGQRVLHLMKKSDNIHFNLDGMLDRGRTARDIFEYGSDGIGQGNVTNWEFFQAMRKHKDKTTIYIDGKAHTPDSLGL